MSLFRRRVALLLALLLLPVVALLAPATHADAVAPTGSLTLTTANPTVGQALTFHYSLDAGSVNAKNWIGIYNTASYGPTNQVYSGHGSTTYQYVGAASGDVTFSASSLSGLTAGTKSAFLLYNDGYQWLAQPLGFSLAPAGTTAPAGTLSLTTTSPVIGSPLTFHYNDAGKTNSLNWIGIYDDPANGPINQTDVAASTIWHYVPSSSGDFTFTGAETAQLTAGFKAAYFLYNDGYTWLASPISFYIAAPLKPVAANLPFDGNLLDTSGSGTTVTATGTPTYDAGVQGQAIHVTSTTHVALPQNAETTFGANDDFSVEFWMKQNSVVSDAAIFANKNWAHAYNPGLVLFNGSGGLTMQYTGATVNATSNSATGVLARSTIGTVSGGGWHLVDVTLNHSTQTLTAYLDGVQTATQSVANSPGGINSGLPFMLDQDGTGSYANTYDADVDNLQVDRTVLSPQTVAADYAAYAAPAHTGQVEKLGFDNTTADASGYSNNPTTTSTPVYAPGIDGKALKVNASQYVTLPNNNDTTFGTNDDFSVDFWMQQNSVTSDGAIFSDKDWAHAYNPGLVLFNVGGSVTMQFTGRNVVATSNSDTTKVLPRATLGEVDDGNWHQIAVTYDHTAQTITAYFDGQQVAQQSTANSPGGVGSPYPFRIDQDGTGAYAYQYDAQVDDFQLDRAVLSPAAISTEYSTVNPPPAPAGHFVTDDFLAGYVHTGGSFSQNLSGLFVDPSASSVSYSEEDGDDWLSVSPAGVVTGTAPATAPAHPALIDVTATDNNGVSDTTTVEVGVYSGTAPPQLKTASLNMWDDGAHVTNSLAKNEAIVLNNQFDVVGLQETGGTGAAQLAAALGWYSYQSSGDLGIISRYPITNVTEPTASAPAAGATITAGNRSVRVWTTDLDDTGYGPEAICLNGVTPANQIAAEQASTRYAQATAVLAAMHGDLAAAKTTPVVLLGDLESPSQLDWTAATSAQHCNAGAVDWPVTQAFADAGLTDTYRAANPDPSTDPGNTWSPFVQTNATANAPEPQDRIDYVDEAGDGLTLVDSDAVVVGFPAAAGVPTIAKPADTLWTSDHAAPATTFTFTPPPSPVTTTTLTAPTSVPRGSSLTLTAKVTGDRTVPAGSVQFLSNGTAIPGCEAVALTAGSATCTIAKETTLPSVTVQAKYLGNTPLLPSASAVQTVTVTGAVTQISVQASAGPLLAVFQVHVTSTMGTVNGTVHLTASVNGHAVTCLLGNNLTLINGYASCTAVTLSLSNLTPPYSVTADYLGNTQYAASEGTAVRTGKVN